MPESFFQLEIWKRGYELALAIYRLTANFPSSEQFGITSQLRRSANSIIANIAESQGRFSYNDRIRVLYLSRGEIFETRSHIKIAEGLGYITKDKAFEIDNEYTYLLKQLNSFIGHLSERRNTRCPIN